MRAIIASFLLVTLIALGWAVQTPLRASWNVNALSHARIDGGAAEGMLLRLGQGALPALREGLRGKSLNAQFHCARILMVMGQSDGEEFLLRQLQAHASPADGIGREAEAFLLSAWDARGGPNDIFRKKLSQSDADKGLALTLISALSECLLRYPNWADGYARRARLNQQSGQVFEARNDALIALSLAPNHFEAILTLGRVQMAVDAPHHAYKCFERAILVNPRMKETLKNEMRDALKAIKADNVKQREEKRKSSTVV